jgi:flagellar basal body-associated protein FliL
MMEAMTSQLQAALEVATVPAKRKKKACWLRTILWMLSMVLLVNAVMAVIAYFLFFYKW